MAYVGNNSAYTHAIHSFTGWSKFVRYPEIKHVDFYNCVIRFTNLQMPLNKANCGILSVLAQLKDVPADYLPIYFRYSFIIYFCETYTEYQVRVIHWNIYHYNKNSF